MKALMVILSVLLPLGSISQPLTSINFKDWYDPENEVQLTFQVIKSDSMHVHYRLVSRAFNADKYTITWEKRDSYTQREGIPIPADTLTTSMDKQWVGKLSLVVPAKPWLLVAKVTNKESKKSWVYFKLIDPAYPINGWLENEAGQVHERYVTIHKAYTVNSAGSQPLFVSYYRSDFQAATPPFSDKTIKADRFMFYDSTFKAPVGSKFIPNQPGLYLFQRDTNAAEGFAFRCVSEIYPKFSKIADLAEPLIYVTTPEEYGALVNANGDKAKFDKVILDITRDKDRAKTFMRNYFRRIELANLYFSSYKTGWKTDRGMIYTIFGLPDEVSINDGSESWNYDAFKVRFTFVKSGSVYDPDNYVLLRDKRFTESWFSTIDLWRKSRF